MKKLIIFLILLFAVAAYAEDSLRSTIQDAVNSTTWVVSTGLYGDSVSETSYWKTARTDYWASARTDLWSTARNTEIP